MGQYWIFVNLDTRESRDCGKLREFVPFSHSGSVSGWLLTMLLPPAIEPKLDELNDRISRRATRSRLGGDLGRLNIPTELLYMIFSELDCLEDVACLCIANSALWVIGFARVLELVKKHPAPWEGQRLIFVGDYTEDLPDGLLKPEETQEFEKFSTFYKFAYERYTESYRAYGKWGFSRPLRWNEREAFGLLAYPGILGYSGFEYSSSYYRDRKWLLCNLSKKEYVRSSKILDTVADAIHLGDVLLSQIFCSTHPSTSMCYEGDLHRGAWAGDCFVVWSVEELEQHEKKDGTWKDVSEEVLKTVVEIWRSERGPKWPEDQT
ncbi:hypothetical protein NEOLEDRAFT_1246212 [Neolentinus lepideus HHB14362 ss-1]|uniref:F-box domain-containing protein n=1 Tax=Neolentinus lepideus HHB14362 ss-1 TaxID=1314782 RepID=A0A165MW31_9AGAM|nr:hypothetical protein NEOLEDRAFT_1246212 [Neolentinus lepideus HHB14362 ss-1]